jgi:PQQ-like domain
MKPSILQNGLALIISLWLISCQRDDPYRLAWRKELPYVSCYSSPKAADLNNDGVLDIVIGAGSGEWQKSDTAIVALDGSTGAMLWRISGRNQIVGSAVFIDVNKDNIPDVIIGGRSAELKAIDGKSGAIIWEFLKTDDAFAPKVAGWYNFFSPQLIPDQSNDTMPDLLISNGGDGTAVPTDLKRPAGKLMVINSATGKIIAQATMPDGKETYMSPVIIYHRDKQPFVYFGTGGETIGGHLYKATLENVMKQDLSEAIVLAESLKKGFVAPPLLVDITHDSIPDVIVNAVEGKMMAIDGNTDLLLWEVGIPYAEAYTSPAPGFFNADSTLDFFVNYAIGSWPNFLRAVQVAVDGKTGKIILQYETGTFSYASPLTVDLNHDGFSEALLSINYDFTHDGKYESQPWNKVVVFDVHHKMQYPLADSSQSINWASTPWIGDLDKNGRMDIVYINSAATNKYDPESASKKLPVSSTISRIEFEQNTYSVLWGSYMGNTSNNIFSNTKANRNGK